MLQLVHLLELKKDLKLKHGQYKLFVAVIKIIDLVRHLVYFIIKPFQVQRHIFLFFLYWVLTYMIKVEQPVLELTFF